jgi:hypothetical protein
MASPGGPAGLCERRGTLHAGAQSGTGRHRRRLAVGGMVCAVSGASHFTVPWASHQCSANRGPGRSQPPGGRTGTRRNGPGAACHGTDAATTVRHGAHHPPGLRERGQRCRPDLQRQPRPGQPHRTAGQCPGADCRRHGAAQRHSPAKHRPRPGGAQARTGCQRCGRAWWRDDGPGSGHYAGNPCLVRTHRGHHWRHQRHCFSDQHPGAERRRRSRPRRRTGPGLCRGGQRGARPGQAFGRRRARDQTTHWRQCGTRGPGHRTGEHRWQHHGAGSAGHWAGDGAGQRHQRGGRRTKHRHGPDRRGRSAPGPDHTAKCRLGGGIDCRRAQPARPDCRPGPGVDRLQAGRGRAH